MMVGCRIQMMNKTRLLVVRRVVVFLYSSTILPAGAVTRTRMGRGSAVFRGFMAGGRFGKATMFLAVTSPQTRTCPVLGLRVLNRVFGNWAGARLTAWDPIYVGNSPVHGAFTRATHTRSGVPGTGSQKLILRVNGSSARNPTLTWIIYGKTLKPNGTCSVIILRSLRICSLMTTMNGIVNPTPNLRMRKKNPSVTSPYTAGCPHCGRPPSRLSFSGLGPLCRYILPQVAGGGFLSGKTKKKTRVSTQIRSLPAGLLRLCPCPPLNGPGNPILCRSDATTCSGRFRRHPCAGQVPSFWAPSPQAQTHPAAH